MCYLPLIAVAQAMASVNSSMVTVQANSSPFPYGVMLEFTKMTHGVLKVSMVDKINNCELDHCHYHGIKTDELLEACTKGYLRGLEADGVI